MVLRTWLSLALVLSGVAKLHHPHRATDYISGSLKVRTIHEVWLVFVISAVEIGLGIALASGAWVVTSAGLALLLFTVALFVALRHRSATGCGCFGILDAGRGSRRFRLGRDLVLALAAGVVLLWSDSASRPVWTDPAFAVGATLLIVMVIAHLLFFDLNSHRSASSQGPRVATQPHHGPKT